MSYGDKIAATRAQPLPLIQRIPAALKLGRFNSMELWNLLGRPNYLSLQWACYKLVGRGVVKQNCHRLGLV